MHWIQFHILDLLISAKSRRFSELRPENVDSNLFQWHLKHLISQNLVAKLPEKQGYELSPHGFYWADRLSRKEKIERKQPKIITIIALQNSHGEFLLHVENRQPYIGTARFPAGKIHNDESLAAAARREIHEKFGVDFFAENFDKNLDNNFAQNLKKDEKVAEKFDKKSDRIRGKKSKKDENFAKNLKSAGSVHMRIRKNGELTSEYYGFVFRGNFDGILPENALWFDAKNPPREIILMPSVREIISYVSTNSREMREFEIEMKS